MTVTKSLAIAVLVAALAGPSLADSHNAQMDMMATGLMMPEMNAAEGRRLFAERGCVVCHSINGVGGTDAPMLDAEFMDNPMNPFEFAARMWRGAEAMVELQRDELGGVIELNGEELAAIIAFVHDAEEQAKFTEADIPEVIEDMMHHEGEDDHHAEGESDDHG
jgi:mono/diheme cytochrome c family protein